jgi:hypothetical protein
VGLQEGDEDTAIRGGPASPPPSRIKLLGRARARQLYSGAWAGAVPRHFFGVGIRQLFTGAREHGFQRVGVVDPTVGRRGRGEEWEGGEESLN